MSRRKEKNTIKVAFIVPHPFNTAPSQRLKFEQYFDFLKANNIHIGFFSFITPDFRKILYQRGKFFQKAIHTIGGYLRRIAHLGSAFFYDVIYIHLEATPLGPPILEYCLYKCGKPIIYDIDDLVYLPHSSDANAVMKRLRTPDKIKRIVTWSSHVIVCTDHLKKFSKQLNPNVTNISSTIDTNKYFVKNTYENTGPICIGWSGSRSTSIYLYALSEVFRQIKKKYPIVKIKVIGDKNFSIPGVEINAIDWCAEKEVKELQEVDIGLYPLPHEEWVLGKSGLKALQYMGLGIPAICTALGTNFEIIENGKNGFLVNHTREWVEKISLLIEQPQLRKEIGMAGRKTVEERYSIEVNAPRYLDIINKVYRSHRNCP